MSKFALEAMKRAKAMGISVSEYSKLAALKKKKLQDEKDAKEKLSKKVSTMWWNKD